MRGQPDVQEGDKVRIEYTIYHSVGMNRERRETALTFRVERVTEHGELMLGGGAKFDPRPGHLFDDRGNKVGIDGRVEVIEE